MDKDTCLTGITLLQLRTFFAVVQNRGIRKAAEVLFVDPSTAKTHMHNLEATLGVKLVVFQGNVFHLTKAGEILYERARMIPDTLWGAVEEINNLTAGLQGLIRINTPISLSMYLLVPTVEEVFRTHFPLIKVELMISPEVNSLDRLLRGECDLTIAEVPFRDRVDPALVCQEYFVDRLICAKLRGSAPHPKTLIHMALGGETHVEIAAKYGLNVTAGIRYNGFEEARRLGKDTGGLMLVSEFAVLSELRTGLFERYEHFHPVYRRTICFVYRKDSPVARVIQRFMDYCIQNLPYELARNSGPASR